MSKMMRLFANQVAKEVVYEALKQYPSAIPWFVGINDDWTIGHLKYDSSNKCITFRSENFSERNFSDICYFISEQIETEVKPEFIIPFANFNNEPGRLAVKQFTEAISCLIMEQQVRPNEKSDRRNHSESQHRLRNGVSGHLPPGS